MTTKIDDLDALRTLTYTRMLQLRKIVGPELDDAVRQRIAEWLDGYESDDSLGPKSVQPDEERADPHGGDIMTSDIIDVGDRLTRFSMDVGGESVTAHAFAPQWDLDPRMLKGKLVRANGLVRLVKAVETFAVADPTGTPFCLVFEDDGH
jgi:hypothetical protein